MIDAISQVGDDLKTFVTGIDITDIEPDGWAHVFNRVFLPEEVTAGGYPTLVIVPAEDSSETLDSATDRQRVTYWVTILTSMADTFQDGEGTIRRLADRLRNSVAAERLSPAPLGNDAYDLTVAGTWGWEPERAERFYRLIVTVSFAQDMD